MPYCVHCGAAVAEGAAACPACGRVPLPPAGSPAAAPTSPRKGLPKSAIFAIVAAVGCLPAIAVLGIVAAILVPNFLDALEKAKQKRTIADLRQIEEALAGYALEAETGAPSAAEFRFPDATSITELAVALAPYGEIPRVDGWKRPFRYACARAAVGVGCNEFRLVSAGRDGVFEHEDPWHYEPGTFERSDYDADLVLGSYGFVRQPELQP